jgi:molybdopterin/thiamine biosynthesis adenylyltransferase
MALLMCCRLNTDVWVDDGEKRRSTMSFLPWYERSPERLEMEKTAYADEGLDFELDASLLERRGVVEFAGAVAVGGEVRRLRVVYPSNFPNVRPEVVYDAAEAAPFARHQNPYERNLCLLRNEDFAWDEDDTGAMMVRQAASLIEANLAGSQAVAAGEVDAPEPASAWLPYTEGASLIVLEQPHPAAVSGAFGEFTVAVRLPYPGYPFVQAFLVGVEPADGGSKSAWRLSQTLRDAVGLADEFKGSWVRTGEPPPYLPGPDGRGRGGHAEYLKWAGGVDRKLDYRLSRQVNKQPKVKSFAAIYPDEGPQRGQFHDNWLVGLELPEMPRHRLKQGAMLLRPYLWTADDAARRVPSLRGLDAKQVMVFGLGALGSPLAAGLARAGVGRMLYVDPDVVDPGPFVRQDFDLRDVGLSKVMAALLRAKAANPRLEVEGFPMMFGGAAVDAADQQPGRDPLVEFAETKARDCDLLVDTTGNPAVRQVVNEIGAAYGIPCVFAWVLNGAWGGRVFRAEPGRACYECFRWRSGEFAPPPSDPADVPLYARGCGLPTFTGTGFDAAAVAGLATRLSVQTLLKEGGGATYPDAGGNLLHWGSRGEATGLDWPRVEQFTVEPDARCRVCHRYGRL